MKKRHNKQLVVTLRRALTDPALLGNVLGGDSWRAWRVLLIAAMGEALDDDERALFKQITGRDHEPLQRVEEICAVIGRRGGKSRAISALAVYEAALCDHSGLLAPGERGLVLCIAPDIRQARVVLDYCAAIFESTPLLRELIAGRTTDTLSLKSGIDIEVRAANFRRIRGHTFVSVIADECAFYFSEDSASANPDVEILNACRPGLATTGGLLAMVSSPYAKRGELFETYKRHYGPAGDASILVAQGESRTFNPSLPRSVVDRALERDYAAASAEYLAQFRSDIEGFVSREQVEACIERGMRERAPVDGARYFSFTDPSGGSADSMACAVGHLDGDMLVVDALREIKALFDPESAVEEIAQLLALYKLDQTTGDRYSAQWCAQAFEKRNIKYEDAEQNKSQLYLEMLPRINAKTIRLLDHPRAINQICLLERRSSRGGRDSIDHPPNTHDDVANAIAGLCGLASGRATFDSSYSWVGVPDIDQPSQPGQRSLWSHPIFGLNIYG